MDTDLKAFRPAIMAVLILSLVESAIIGGVAGYLGASFALSRAPAGRQPSTAERPRPIADNSRLAEEQPLAAPSAGQGEEIINAVKRSSSSVVSIVITKDLPIIERYNANPFEEFGLPGDDLFDQFLRQFQRQAPRSGQRETEKRQVGGGTGFVISADGLILTNKHVVADANADYTVIFNGGSKFPAKVLARDPVEDLAVLKIEKRGLKALALGDSDTLQIGQAVVAIGNALGEFQNTVSVGVVSGLNRSITAATGDGKSERIQGVIQTDAAINRGNSGGPLLNLRGEVVAINTAIVLGAQNVGFAIPINKAKKDIRDVSTLGKIVTPFLGVRYLAITKELAKENDLPVDYGALVIHGERRTDLAVMPASPADKAGIVENDIILELNGAKINPEKPLANLIAARQVGEVITLKILHRGETRTVPVKLEERK